MQLGCRNECRLFSQRRTTHQKHAAGKLMMIVIVCRTAADNDEASAQLVFAGKKHCIGGWQHKHSILCSLHNCDETAAKQLGAQA